MTVRFLKMSASVACLALSLGMAGCSIWPQHGHGGFAEHRMGLSGSLAHDRFDDHRDNRIGTRYFGNILQDGYTKRGRIGEARYVHDFAIIAFDERIAYLKARGAERCAPGDLAQAEQLLVRVKREWVSDLYGDALIDIDKLEHRLDILDNRLFHSHCQQSKVVVDTPAHSQKTIYKRPVRHSAPVVLK